jgi:hypothetical protein
VQVGGDLGALLGADALRALVGQAAREAQPEGQQDEAQAESDHDERQHEVARAAQRAVGLQEQQAGADDECDAEAALVDGAQALGEVAVGIEGVGRAGLGGRGCGRLAQLGRALAGRPRRLRRRGPPALRLAPQHRHARDGQDERPDDGVAPPEAQLAGGEQGSERQAAGAQSDLPGAGPRPQAGGQGGRAVVGAQQHPAGDVDRDPDAGDDGRDHDDDAQQERVDAERPGRARAHAGDDLAVQVPAQRRTAALIAQGAMALREIAQRAILAA